MTQTERWPSLTRPNTGGCPVQAPPWQGKMYLGSSSANCVYDLVGKIQQVTDPTGTYGFAYDNMGRLIGTTTAGGPRLPS